MVEHVPGYGHRGRALVYAGLPVFSRRVFLRLVGMTVVGMALAGCGQPAPVADTKKTIVEGSIASVSASRRGGRLSWAWPLPPSSPWIRLPIGHGTRMKVVWEKVSRAREKD